MFCFAQHDVFRNYLNGNQVVFKQCFFDHLLIKPSLAHLFIMRPCPDF